MMIIFYILVIVTVIYLSLKRKEKLEADCANLIELHKTCLKHCLEGQCSQTSGNWCALHCLDSCGVKK